LFELLEQREPEVTELISGVPGFVSYGRVPLGRRAGMTVTTARTRTAPTSRRGAPPAG